MSASVITVETHEDLFHKLIIQRPSFGLFLSGRIRVAGDFDFLHHALMLGALAEGETEI
ncbi:hypothetical protein [Nostoc sp.]